MRSGVGTDRRPLRTNSLLAACCLLCIAGFAGCVTEKKPVGFVPPPKAPPPQLPPGPVASPVPTTATTSSLVQVQFVSLGTLRYDGQVLPVVSPDGRFIAAQSGEPPSWPTLLADQGAQTPVYTRIAAYDISEPAQSSGAPAKRIEWATEAPPGVTLGRSADARGFLVEWPRPDGSRWIGRMPWLGGGTEWLAQGDQVNAHGVFTSQGWLLYTRRAKSGGNSALVLRGPDGTEDVRTTEAGSFVLPLAGSDPEVVYVLRLANGTLYLDAIHLVVEEGRPPRLGSVISEGTLGSPADLALAYQASTSVQGAVVAPPHGEGITTLPADDPPLIYHPGYNRMAIFDTRVGGFAGLAPNAISAVRWDAPGSGGRGYLCTTPQGLVYFPMPKLPGDMTPPPGLQREVRVMAMSWVPRLTINPERPVILFGPAARTTNTLEVFAMRPAAPPAPPANPPPRSSQPG
jgi:hypothetical protein